MRRIVCGFAVIALGVAGSGCSSGAAGPSSRTVDPAALFAPALTAAQAREVNSAIEELIRRCMNQHGFTYYVISESPTNDSSPTTAPINFHYIDVARLRSVGYWNPQDLAQAAHKVRTAADDARERNVAYVQSLSAAEQQRYNEAAYGTKSVRITLPGNHVLYHQTGGCASKAWSTLYGDDVKQTAVFTEAQDVLTALNAAVDRSSAWKAAMRQWRACMQRHGYSYRDEDAILTDLDKRRNVPGGDQTAFVTFEKSLAKIDADCAEQAHLNEVSDAQLRQAAKKITDRQNRVILEWHDMDQHAYAVARQILSQK